MAHSIPDGGHSLRHHRAALAPAVVTLVVVLAVAGCSTVSDSPTTSAVPATSAAQSTTVPATTAVSTTTTRAPDATTTTVTTAPSAADVAYGSYLGGPGDDGALVLAAPGGGLILFGSSSEAGGLPWVANSVSVGAGGDRDMFVARLDASRQPLWSMIIGGSGFDNVWSAAIDGEGAIYVLGESASVDFPTTPGVLAPEFGGGESDAVVIKVDPDGQRLVYGTYLGGSGDDWGTGEVTVDATGSALVSGRTGSVDFPVTASAFQSTFAGGDGSPGPFGTNKDVFLARLDPGATSLVFSTYLGGSGDEGTSGGPVVDAEGNLYMVGATTSKDFPVTPGAFQQIQKGGPPERPSDGWVAKFDTAGTLIWSTFVGSNAFDVLRDIEIDPEGLLAVVGVACSGTAFSVTMTRGAFQPAIGGKCDSIVAKLDPANGYVVSASYLGGPGDEFGDTRLAVDAGGRVIVITENDTATFPVTDDALRPKGGTLGDVTLSIISSDLTHLDYSTYLGGGLDDWMWGAPPVIDEEGLLYVTLGSDSLNLPTTANAFQPTPGGGEDIFMYVFDIGP